MVRVKFARPVAGIVILGPVNMSEPKINTLLKVVPLIVTVPWPNVEPAKVELVLITLPLTQGKQEAGPVLPKSAPTAVAEKLAPLKL